MSLSNHLEALEEGAYLLQFALFILWHLWKSINALIFHDEKQDFCTIILAASAHLEDFSDATNGRNNDDSHATQAGFVPIYWRPPASYVVKIKFNVTIDKQCRKGCLGIIA